MKSLLFHWVGWHGKDGPSATGYDSRDPKVISHQLSAMGAVRGAMKSPRFGVIALTFGPTVSPFIHTAVMEMSHQCTQRNIPFALCFDPWVVKGTPNLSATGAVIQALQHPDTQKMLNSKNYLSGKPVLDFATGADVNAVISAVPGVDYLATAKGYSWIRLPNVVQAAQIENAATKIPTAFPSFDDGTGPDRNKQIWAQSLPARIALPRSGGLFWDMYDAASGNPSEWIQIGTWNDVAENPVTLETFGSMCYGRIG